MGSRDGDFLGYVDRQPDGAYRAFDARSAVIGDFPGLADATGAVSASSERDRDDDGSPTGDLEGLIR
ncbi:hypothetical protein [Microbacterium sp. NPDC089695]|uniref:hypothetical protein n=1 Tax=Microbacterium sp. NPDC089695 TaxID=3364198 RepID=UPI00381C4246